MHYLNPWFEALRQSTATFRFTMAELGVYFEEGWASKASIVALINELCQTDLKQKEIWHGVYDSRKSLDEKYDFLFPEDPKFQRKRTWCHTFEAWYTIALFCQKYSCLHKWLRYFNLSDAYDLIEAKQILITGEIIVNGLHIEGQGIIKL